MLPIDWEGGRGGRDVELGVQRPGAFCIEGGEREGARKGAVGSARSEAHA